MAGRNHRPEFLQQVRLRGGSLPAISADLVGVNDSARGGKHLLCGSFLDVRSGSQNVMRPPYRMTAFRFATERSRHNTYAGIRAARRLGQRSRMISARMSDDTVRGEFLSQGDTALTAPGD